MGDSIERHRITQRVGDTELHLPRLGIGCANLGELWESISATDAITTLINAANTHGISYFDTAPWYGNGCSEIRLGVAAHEMASNGKSKMQISTKVGKFLDPMPKDDGVGPWVGGCNLRIRPDYSYNGVMQQHRESCLRLGSPFVQTLVIHDLDSHHLGNQTEQHLTQLLDKQNGGLRALLELKTSKKIQAIGIGCNSFEWGSLETCKRVFEMARTFELENKGFPKALDFVLCAGDFNLLTQKALDELIPLCEKFKISLVIGAAYGGNGAILARGVKSTMDKDLKFLYEKAPSEIIKKVEAIEDICEKHNVTLGAAALQFPLRHPLVKSVLAGVKCEEEVNLAVKYMNEDIPEAFWDELKASKNIRDVNGK